MRNQNEIDKYLDSLIDKAEEEITKLYARRMKQILKQIQKMYEKYEKDGVLTMAEMSKFGRLDKSMDAILKELLKTQKDAYKIAQTTMERQYLVNYFMSAYLFEFQAQEQLGFGMLSREMLEAAIENKIDQMKLSKLLERNRADIVHRIKTDIQQGLIAGESYGKMANRIIKSVGFDAHKARTVARTEAHRCQIQGRLDSAKKASETVKMQKMWDATLDSRTRPAHRKLDGKVVDWDANFTSTAGGHGPGPGLMMSPGDDINDRCTVVFLVNGEKPEVKRARMEDGKTTVIPYMSYEEWEKARLGDKVI